MLLAVLLAQGKCTTSRGATCGAHIMRALSKRCDCGLLFLSMHEYTGLPESGASQSDGSNCKSHMDSLVCHCCATVSDPVMPVCCLPFRQNSHESYPLTYNQ